MRWQARRLRYNYMKEAIRQRALELGFDACRFTTAAAPASAEQFQNWLDGKRHGEMTWLQRTAPKRVDPQRVLSGARSVICLAASYETKIPNSELRTPNSGVVARYARFADYHDVLGQQLKELTATVNQLGGGGTRSRWYVDTGPLLERDFAQSAGLGFIGKHTNVISRQFGNWILLAEIITTLKLEPDAPEQNHCGKCTRCITACPTRCITAPFQLDARRCISYLTIELNGPIPVELRPAIGNRIFGCDDCLAVCPWNRFAREGKMMQAHARSYRSVKSERAPSPFPSPPSQGEISPRNSRIEPLNHERSAEHRLGSSGKDSKRAETVLGAPVPGERMPAKAGGGEIDLIELLQLDEAGFKSRFAGTPILRTKRRGLLRNVCVALGNVGDKSALPALQKAAADAEPLIAEHAGWAIMQIESRQEVG